MSVKQTKMRQLYLNPLDRVTGGQNDQQYKGLIDQIIMFISFKYLAKSDKRLLQIDGRTRLKRCLDDSEN